MSAAPWTVGRLLQWTVDFLKQRGAESARLDAEILLAEALGCQRIQLYTAYEEEPGEEKRTKFREFVKQRAEGTPVAYLVGRREFYSLNFKVRPGVLIPRPETEFIVLTVLDLVKQSGLAEQRIVDVGTGSGILAVTLAKHLPAARVVAIDTSTTALEVAAENARQHGVAERIEFMPCDLLCGVDAAATFDFIVSNPPYVSAAEYEKLPRDVKNFEPREALLAGPKGTEVIERMLPQAVERLRPGGHLLIEISPMIHGAVQDLLAAVNGLQPGPTVKDLSRLPRVVVAKKT
jgi:release factor glutamine methyltransferase